MNTSLAYKQQMTDTRRQYDSIVVGLGKTGVSVVDYLLAQGQRIAVVDSRRNPPGLDSVRQRHPQLPLFLGEFDVAVLASAEQLVLSPGVALAEPAIQEALAGGVKLSSDVELFCQQTKTPIIAVTGSNGKSTVVSLVTAMIEESGFKARLAGNIGTPVLDVLADRDLDYYVLELSSFQLETLQSLNAAVALVLNVSADHMDRYTDLQAYSRAKERIYAGSGKMILNRDDSAVAAMSRNSRELIYFGAGVPENSAFGVRKTAGESWLCYGQERLLAASELKIHGAHNIANALASLALGTAIGLPLPAMLSTLKSFAGLPHRCQWLTNIDGVDWYNDSKGTNVGASCAAIEGLAEHRPVILIAGGEGKQADFGPLASTIAAHVKAVILIGKDAGRINETLDAGTTRYFATSMEAAVSAAAGLAVAGDVVLLSPACASLDMYRDYQHRGDVFMAAVAALPGVRP